MKVSLDDEVLFEIGDNDLKCICNRVNKKNLYINLRQLVYWNIKSYCVQAFEDLKKEWLPILFKRYESIPTDDEKLANLIFSQPDYRDQEAREAQDKAERESTFKVE